MDEKLYNEIDAERFSRLKAMAESPLAYHSQEPRDSTAMLLGRAIHCAVLEPSEFASRYATWDGASRRGKEYERFAADHAEQDIMTRAECDLAAKVAHAVRSSYAAELLDAIEWVERGFGWIDGDTKIACKCRPDAYLRGAVLLDLKTTRAASIRAFARDAGSYCYDAQLSFYRHGLRCNEVPARDVLVLTAQTVAPFDVVVYRLREDRLAEGERLWRGWLRQVAECRRLNSWPGVANNQVLDLEPYRYESADESWDRAVEEIGNGRPQAA